VQKRLQCDLESRQVKRKSEKTKNEMMREMIHACLQNALKFRFVLMDSWFSSQENFDFITGRGRHFIAALKDNRLVALSQEDWEKKRFVRVDKLEFPEQSTVQGWLKGADKAVRLARIFHATPRHEPVEVDFGALVAGAVRFDSFAQTLECNRS
jgi:hypothetical protein